MPAGGTTAIRTAQEHGFVRVEISDTGVGLTPEERARLFTPYYAVGVQSSGLGLATVQSVVTEHGGRISAESAPGKGTTYRLEFPAAPEIFDPGLSDSSLSESGMPGDERVARPAGRVSQQPADQQAEAVISSRIGS